MICGDYYDDDVYEDTTETAPCAECGDEHYAEADLDEYGVCPDCRRA